MPLAAKHLDLVLGIDIHIVQPPGTVPPMPIPHPFAGILFDPFDYLPIFGAYATLDTSLGRESFFVMLVLLSTATFFYQTLMLMLAGRTTGMALLNLELLNTDDDSLPVTRRQKMLRAIVAADVG